MNLGRILPLAVVLTFSSYSPLLAGPIQWSYSTSIGSNSDPSIDQVFVRNGGSGAGGSWLLWADFQSEPLTSASDSASIRLGYTSVGSGNAAIDFPKTFDTNFRLTVSITDAASNQSGSVSFFGFFTAPDDLFNMPNSLTVHITNSTESILLGENRYNVSLAELDWQGSPFMANVNVAPVTTPEPTSLGLAAIGMSLVFAARRGSALVNRAG